MIFNYFGLDEIEQVVVANVSNVTGGRGNPLYREELTKSAEGEGGSNQIRLSDPPNSH